MNALLTIGILAVIFESMIGIAVAIENFRAIKRFCWCVVQVIGERLFKAQTAYYKRRQRRHGAKW